VKERNVTRAPSSQEEKRATDPERPIAIEDDVEWNLELSNMLSVPEDGTRRPEMPAAGHAPGSVGFCDEGIVSPHYSVPMLESLLDQGSFTGEELRLLSAKIQDLRRERGIGCIAVTSTLPAEGKSTVSVGLAGALAREPGRRILLIEADLRQPSLTMSMGLPHAAGLGEWLNGAIEYAPVRLVEPGGFFLMVSGQATLERPELLGSARMDNLLRAARGLFDFVILDTTPVLSVADVILIQDLVDGFLMVVRSRQTTRGALRDALSRLRPDRVLGVVLNDHHEVRPAYKDRGYGAYGYGAKPYGARPYGAKPQVKRRR
jgi:capsular exopolysaccharide synthesis family protein